ncbi:MAG TPA: alpha-1,4-glucan--maltose-1-phosphate maltosyltransferase [Gemmatimonadaceae bacterium]|nr:alpha-1,4-glucan--maltose-1-phosphate maltosyltransferase [Gemmatimonadaceae bacterium]
MTTPATRAARQRASARTPVPDTLPRLVIECVTPELDGGRFPVKRAMGDSFEVGADIFKDGHDILAARVRWRAPDEAEWRTAPMSYDPEADRWAGGFPLDRIGMWTYTVEAWTDAFATWRAELQKKLEAGQDVHSELLEGAVLIEQAERGARFGEGRTTLKRTAAQLRDAEIEQSVRAGAALAPGLLALMVEHWRPRHVTVYDRELRLWVDREGARFASWYELFPRSQSPLPGEHGTFADTARALERVAALGFDVVYLPPIHPIGLTNRKGKNNSLEAGPDDVGSPWAIGGAAGGHTATHPDLGTIEEFDRMVARAHELGLEIALDYALQCSPDHPWLKEHPEWFFIRPDGTLKYAENPPKKYQDIYPLDFWCEDRERLWAACRDVLLFWVAHGVRTFRVDNPHTKPLAFWEWVIREVQSRHPEVVFLSEAFTRPKKMKRLAKLGFTQSYTYFTWKNTPREIRDWLAEFEDARDYYRGNLFTNTPDILNEYLVRGGRNAFRIRLLLAGTLSPLYGIYSGFELCENVPLRPGSEEYLDSEKYQIRQRDWDAPGNINADVARLNIVRRENPALQLLGNLTFGESDEDAVLCYTRTAPGNDLIICVTTDPSRPRETVVTVPLEVLDLRHDESYVVHDLLTGARWTWRGPRNYVRLDPSFEPGHVLRVER